jgi:hypothetical protein
VRRCIAAHARGAAVQNATEAEVAEAMAVVVLMNGGPGTVWGPRSLDAYREFAAAKGASSVGRRGVAPRDGTDHTTGDHDGGS